MYLNDLINQHLMSGSHIKTERFPSFYPSSASCVNQIDDKSVVGSCIRQQYYKFAGYQESNPPTLYSQWIFASGNIWESYLTEQLKEMGLWLANNVKFVNTDLIVSGEIDILIKGPNYNPTTGTGKYIVENKTYAGNNYVAKKEICGSKDNPPRPKDSNLLQSFIYLCTFRDQVDCVILNYIDRSCSGPENNKEFHIHIYEENDEIYPRITTSNFYGQPLVYIDRRISYRAIKNRFESLVGFLRQKKIPDPEFQHKYTDSQVHEKYKLGLIYKTKYEDYCKSPETKPIGDYQCSNIYCSYSDLCLIQKNIDGHL